MAEDECKYVPPWTQGVCNIRVDLPAAFCGDGRKLFATWIKQFEAAVRAQTRGDGRSYAASLTALLPTRLDGAPFFVVGQPALVCATCVSARPRGASESLELYAADLSRLVAEAFPEYDKMAQNGEKFRRFLAGLDPGLRAKCHEQGATDLEEALMIAGRCERARMALGVGLQSGPGSHPAPATVASLSAAEGTALGTSGVTGKLLGAVERLTDRMDKLQMEVVNLRAQRSDHTPRTSQGFPCACECGGFGCRSSAREHRVECNGRAPRYGSRNNREWSPQAQEDRGAAPDYPHRREEDETPRRGRFSVEPEWRRGVRFLSPARRSPSRRSPSLLQSDGTRETTSNWRWRLRAPWNRTLISISGMWNLRLGIQWGWWLHRAYRTSPDKRREIDRQVQRLLADGEGSNVRRLQQEDPDIRSLLEWLRAGERPSSVRIKGAGKALRILWHEFPRMTMIDGIVHRVVALSDVEQTWQVVVHRFWCRRSCVFFMVGP
uniref:Uncharacterized protein n=1 Tax=Knipowitschia caucasica TaxID=637954 RepID=A0AAV2KA86_KNICA